MPTCLATPPSRIRSTSTSPGRARPARTGDEVPRRRRQQILGAAPAPTSPACRAAPPRAPARAARARARAAAPGSRSRRRGSSPGAGRACRSSARASRDDLVARGGPLLASAVMDRSILGIGGHPVLARDVRKAAEVRGNCRTSPGRSPRACRSPPTSLKPVARRDRPRRLLPELDAAAPPPPDAGRTSPRRSLRRSRRSASVSVPCVNQPSAKSAETAGDDAARPPTPAPPRPPPRSRPARGRNRISRRPSTRSQVRSSAAADRRVQRLGQPAQLDLEPRRPRGGSRRNGRGTAAPAGPAAPSRPASARSPPGRSARRRMSSSRDRRVAQRPDRLGVVDAEAGRALQRAGVHAAARAVTSARRSSRSRSWSVKPSATPSRRRTRQQRQSCVAPPSSRACSSGSIARIRPAPRPPGSTGSRPPRSRPGSR